MLDGSFDQSRLIEHISILLAICVRERQQHSPKTRPAIVVLRRKIRSTVKRLAVGREKGGKRPAALSAHGLHSDLIPAINVGALIAIDFDRDKTLIHYLRDIG